MKSVLKFFALAFSVLLCFSIMFTLPVFASGNQSSKTFNMALHWLPGDLQPWKAWNGWVLTRVGAGENLVQIDEKLNMKAGIAESWEQIDSNTMAFKIRKGVVFHNGKALTPYSCKTSIERTHRITDRKGMRFPLESITVSGDRMIIKTTQPYATLLNTLADPLYIIVDAENAEKNPDTFKFSPVLTGPYKVSSFEAGVGMSLKKNDAYWKSQKPTVDTINAKLIKQASTRAMALQSGEIDFAPKLSLEELKVLEKDDRFVVQKGPNLRIFFVRINFDRPILKNLSFRQAMVHGISKDIYAEKLAGAFPARGPFNPILPFGGGGNSYYPYNPQKAKQLLNAAGFVDTDGDGIREYNGKNIVLQYVFATKGGNEGKNIGTAMQSQYKAIGIGIKLQQYESTDDVVEKGKFDIAFSGWVSAPAGDPQYFLDASYKTGGYGNYGNYSNPEFEKIIATLSTTLATNERYRLGREGNNLLMKDVASLFIYYGIGNIVTHRKVKGVHRFMSGIYYIDERLGIK
jgi:peptide/nickel transport system substrate-binding protein